MALVTGAARGMGGAIAERLAQEGADMAVADMRDTLLQDTARPVTALGRCTVALSVDVTDTAQVEQVGPDSPGCSGTIVDR
jgi:NAD(P)-dependent dehydrogenase (short-subunit alcohol dehydrogenase family)